MMKVLEGFPDFQFVDYGSLPRKGVKQASTSHCANGTSRCEDKVAQHTALHIAAHEGSQSFYFFLDSGLGFGVVWGWGFGVLGFWGFGVLGFWGFGVLGFWGFGVLGFWGFGVLGFWGFWVLGFWGFGVLGFWGFGVLGFWGFGVLGFGSMLAKDWRVGVGKWFAFIATRGITLFRQHQVSKGTALDESTFQVACTCHFCP